MIDMPANDDTRTWAQGNRFLETWPLEMDEDICSMHGLRRRSLALDKRDATPLDMDDDIRSISDMHRRSSSFEDDVDRKMNHPSLRRHPSTAKKAIQHLSFSSSLQRLPRSGTCKRQF